MNQPIILHKLKFPINNDLHELSLSFGLEKTGLVGKNGTGKTSLLKLIMSELMPMSGKITVAGTLAYLPQDYQFDLNQTIAQALGIKEKLKAIVNLKDSPLDESLLKIVGSDWNIENQATTLLQSFGLEKIALSKKLNQLSGGERMKVALSSLFLFPDRFIIMDEPTNNLDAESRKLLYSHISQWKTGMLIVSHDRQLLDLMDRIVEISPGGVKVYGGNYSSYESQKGNEKETSQRLFTTARHEFKKIKTQAQDVSQRQEKRVSHAKKRAATQNIPKAVLNAMKRSGQQTSGKLKTLHDERVADAQEKLAQAQVNILAENHIRVDLSKTEVPKGKLMVELKEIGFDYPDTTSLLENISLSVYGQERVTITGRNGSGKTTLIKLILKKLTPQTGSVKLGTDEIAYLDQEVGVLNPLLSVLDNVTSISGLDADSAREWLSGFLFLGKDVFKKVNQLSGGERIRAGLAAILAGDTPAKLLVLDEPTNNLDLDSIEKIESALIQYRGNLIVISHDDVFIDHIGIDRYISLN